MSVLKTEFPEDMIKVAVDWWAGHLRHGAVGDQHAVDRALRGMDRVLDRLRRPVEEAKVLKFEETLTALLREAPRDAYCVFSTGHISLRTDYDAQGLLRDAMKAADIVPMGKLPFKTWMDLSMRRGRGLITAANCVIYPVDVFEVWEDEDEDGKSLTVASPYDVRLHKEMGILSLDAKFLYAIRGPWEEVMSIHSEIQGWGPYKATG